MPTVENNTLVFSFPEVHPDAVLTVHLNRTFRIPDDGKNYPLPPGLGHFPIRHVDDFKDKVPSKWVGRGGVMVPLYQSEAMWLGFHPRMSRDHGVHYPFAIKVATGKVSAVTGKKWSKKLREGDYMVAPDQQWLDGYVVEDGTIRQFVAAPLGLGVTVEEQVTGKAEFGGLQIEVVPMDVEKFLKRFPKRPPSILRSRGIAPCSTKSSLHGIPGVYSSTVMNSVAGPQGPQGVSGAAEYSCNSINVLTLEEAMAKRPEMYKSKQLQSRGEEKTSASLDMDMLREVSDSDDSVVLSEVNLDMGLAAGGRMTQQVFKDRFGLDEWSKTAKARCYVHMCNSIGWQHLTGSLPPHPPMTAQQYESHGYPWFSYYADGKPSHAGTTTLKGVQSVAQFQKTKKVPILPENQSTTAKSVVNLSPQKKEVRDGAWK